MVWGRFAYTPVCFAFVFGVFAVAKPVLCSAQQPVALELVLAVDTSTSVDMREYVLQRDGLAAAFRHPSVVRSIEGLGPDGAAVALVQWAGPGRQSLSVDWRVLRDAKSAEAMARAIEATRRLHSGFTDIGEAIAFSTAAIETNGFDGERKTIDVSGDGVSERRDPAPYRDVAVAKGITINGLVIYSNEYDLGELASIELHDHYSSRVIGGEGAFLMEAQNFEDFAEAIRRKLVREISGANVVKAPASRKAALSVQAPAR